MKTKDYMWAVVEKTSQELVSYWDEKIGANVMSVFYDKLSAEMFKLWWAKQHPANVWEIIKIGMHKVVSK